ncbi:hypothetical protein Baya_5723 [Bagarius yarrelli]|uniref:Uncharacterized protein n=1 Tax=Bagarius yarrelli TaxID=175774 RepID=A0A556TYC8_BAGYA|nr:hypothetical protein Baya_5723 [Bagarius yarrelli]
MLRDFGPLPEKHHATLSGSKWEKPEQLESMQALFGLSLNLAATAVNSEDVNKHQRRAGTRCGTLYTIRYRGGNSQTLMGGNRLTKGHN